MSRATKMIELQNKDDPRLERVKADLE